MSLTNVEMLLLGSAITAVMMLGTSNIRSSLVLYGVHTLLVAISAILMGTVEHEVSLIVIGLSVLLVKVFFVPVFLGWVTTKVGVLLDSGALLPPPIAMHVGIGMLGASYLMAQHLPTVQHSPAGSIGATAAVSLISSGILLMLTRNIAVNQVIGFLVIENGIFVFSLTQTKGMPLVVELGVMLDVLVGVMIAGLLLFRIKTNFEHIDVSKLNELRD